MPSPYSVDLRQRAVENYLCGGKTMNDVAKTFSIGERTLRRWIKSYQQAGTLEPKTGYQKGYNLMINDLESFKKIIEENNISTIDEIKNKLNIKCSNTPIRKALHKIGFVKKNKKKAIVSKTQSK